MAVMPPPPKEGGDLLTITVPIHQRSQQNSGSLETASDSLEPADSTKKAAGSESGEAGAQPTSPTSPPSQNQQPVQNLPNWIQILLQPNPQPHP